MTPEDIAAKNAALQRAYHIAFSTPDGQIVLRDLMAASGFRVPLADADGTPTGLAIAEGKRRLFLRIISLLELPPEQLQALYGGRNVKMGADG